MIALSFHLQQNQWFSFIHDLFFKILLNGHGHDTGQIFSPDYNVYNDSVRHFNRQPIYECHLLKFPFAM